MPWGRQWPPNNPSPTPVSLTSVRRRWPVTPSLPRPADPNLVVTTPNPQPIQVAQGQEIVTGIKIGVVVQSLETRDSDNDGVLDRAEDLNSDSNLENDDTDGDGLPNYRDADDDGDAILTSIERTLGDTDGDQVLNYLDSDDDNDGVPTALEGSGDSNGNSIPDYLERDVIGNGGNVQRLFLPVVFR